MRPHKCPVCDGTGQRTEWYPCSTVPSTITCHACSGTGVVWEVESPTEQELARKGGGLPLEDS